MNRKMTKEMYYAVPPGPENLRTRTAHRIGSAEAALPRTVIHSELTSTHPIVKSEEWLQIWAS